MFDLIIINFSWEESLISLGIYSSDPVQLMPSLMWSPALHVLLAARGTVTVVLKGKGLLEKGEQIFTPYCWSYCLWVHVHVRVCRAEIDKSRMIDLLNTSLSQPPPLPHTCAPQGYLPGTGDSLTHEVKALKSEVRFILEAWKCTHMYDCLLILKLHMYSTVCTSTACMKM